MSAYGPAFFIKRKDKKEIKKSEQEGLLKLVSKIAADLKIKDDEDNIVKPEFYDYDGYENKAISFVMFASYTYAMMPEHIQDDESEVDGETMLKIGEEINKLKPNTYEYQSYYVEV